MPKRSNSGFTYSNRVELIRGGKKFFQMLKSLIDQAEKTIYFQFYIFDDDDTGRVIADALKAAARRKVRVFLLLDAYASKNLSASFIDDLKESGIHFRWFRSFLINKRFFVGRRLHHKVVVIDSVKGLVCGLNISDRYNDTPESIAWLDWAVYTQGAASFKLEEVCRRRLKDYSHHTQKQDDITGEHCAVKVCVNDWVSRKSEVTQSYLGMLQKAASHVIIMSPYFMPGRTFRKVLKQAARRNVKIQVMLTGVSDIPLSKYAERYMYDWLLKYNIGIYEYQRNVLHGKIAVCDGTWVSVGSYNVNNLSAYASVELNLEIKNEGFAGHVERELQSIMKNDCKQILKEEHERRTNLVKWMVRGLAYNFFRFLLLLFAFRQKD